MKQFANENHKLIVEKSQELNNLTLGRRSVAQRLELIKLYGSHSLAYATLQTDSCGNPLLEYFDTDDGFLAFSTTHCFGTRQIVLGEPICSHDDMEGMLAAFIKRYPRAVFLQIGEFVGRCLEKLGFLVNRFGTETILDIESFSLKGLRRQDIRTLLNRAHRGCVEVRTLPNVDESPLDVEQVSFEWLQSRVVRSSELRFMVRPVLHTGEPYVRRLYAFAREKLVGFAYYDPIFRSGRIVGYHAMTNRFSASAPGGTSYLLDVTMAALLKDEGVPHLALGFAPFSRVGERELFRHSWVAKRSFSFNYSCLNSLYNFRGQDLRKRKFCGRSLPLYFASKGRLLRPFVDLLSTCRVSNFRIGGQILQAVGIHNRVSAELPSTTGVC